MSFAQFRPARRQVLRHAALGMGLAAAIPFSARSAPARFHIAILLFGEPSQPQPNLPVFFEALARRGLVEGDNLTIDRRYIRNFDGQEFGFAAELAALKPDVVFTACGYRCAVAALKTASATIPVVFDAAGNPIGQGLTTSLANPSRNLTGSAIFGGELDFKRLELLAEALGNPSFFAMLQGPLPEDTRSWYRQRFASYAEARRARHLLIEVTGEPELAPAFKRMAREGVDALVVAGSPVAQLNAREIARLCASHRLPAIGEGPGFIEAELLITYTPSFTEVYERAAEYVYRILLGAKPAELPIVQATRFEMVVNLATARTLGVKISSALLLRADRVIE
jgi:putative ABC transport system substrate-binding protein